MARGRMISKALSTSEKRAALHQAVPRLAEFCQAMYPLMVAHSDDFGRLQGDAFTVKHAIEPTSPRPLPDFEAGLQALHTVGLIQWYDASGRKYIQIENFDPHQQGLHKRTKSAFPEPPDSSGQFLGVPSELKGRELNGMEENRTEGAEAHEARFESFWAEYPRKTAKEPARKEWLKSKPSAALTEQILAKVRDHKASPQWTKDRGEFVPHARTWLHQKRWEDEASKAPHCGTFGAGRAPWHCPHVDQCGASAICRNAVALKRPERPGVVYTLDEHGVPRKVDAS